MNNKPPAPASAGLNLGDIYHVLFRHKWKILAVWTAGLLAAAAIWSLWPVKYRSQAQLLVRYILDNKLVSPIGEGNIQTPDSRGDTIISSEVLILKSRDIAKEVAADIGPAAILAKAGGGTNLDVAAAVIASGLTVEAPKDSAVIQASFEHPDPAIVQPVLDQIIRCYLKRQAAIHQPAGELDDLLTRQTDQLKFALQQTEQQLKDAKLKAGVISLEDAKKSFADRLDKIQQDLAEAQAELAARQAALTEMTNLMSAKAGTNSPASALAAGEAPPDKAAQYKRVCNLLDMLGKTLQERLIVYQPDSPRVLEIQQLLATNQLAKDALEKQYPQLVGSRVLQSGPNDQPLVSRQDMISQLTNAKALQARIAVLTNQLAGIQFQMDKVANAEGDITDLQRKQALQATNYMNMAADLERARIDEALNSARISNISTIEAPTPPSRDVKMLYKALAVVLVGAFAAGLTLAFATELYLDRSFKRPVEIETQLRAPLFLSIPRARLNGKHTLADAAQVRGLLAGPRAENGNGAGSAGSPQPPSETKPAPWQSNHSLRSYFETLRDRLMLYFESRNLTHKPKLVAVTSCAEGSGVSTVASGLAASISEIGDGNVLLVDMNEVNGGAAAFFHKGELRCGIDEALEAGKRNDAMVQDNLFVVSETTANGNLPRILHKRFSGLVPRLRASDYDYIIFDMPPVSQISPTPRLARYMDMVFMVVEAERTDRDVVKRATDLLAESKANVGVVLNKHRTYVPRALQQEL